MSYRHLATATLMGVLVSLSVAKIDAQEAASTHESAVSNASSAELVEIIVTARKRSEALQDVPVSVTAVNAATLERNNIVEIDQIGALTPNVVFKPADPGLPILSAYIRGIGERGGEPSQDHPIAVSLDGVYLSGLSGSLLDVFDMQQIEVLRGPQGTLQGRNSPGGAINATTKRPSGELGGQAEASYGRYDELHIRGEVEAPVIQNVLAGKLAVFDNSNGNFMENITTGRRVGGRDDWGARLGFLYTPVSGLTAYLTADYSEDHSPPAPLRPTPHAGSRGPFEPEPLVCTAYGFCTPYGEYQTGSEFTARNNIKNFGTTLNVDYDLGPVTVTSVTGYRDVNEILNIDIDSLPAPILEFRNRRTHSDSASEELRISSNGETRLRYVVGAIGSRIKFDLVNPTLLGTALTGLPIPFVATSARAQTTDSYAVFGQAVYKLTELWSVTGGLRKTIDKKDASAEPFVPGPSGNFRASYNNLSAEAGTEYRLGASKLAYFRFSQGYRAGGINTSASDLAAVNTYRPETVNAYELGLKTEWLNRTLVANVSAFYYNYRDFQVLEVQPYPGGFTTRIGSADGLHIKGVELETHFRPTDALTLTGSVGYLDARYKSQILDVGFGPMDIARFRKDNAPKWTGYVGADYVVPVFGSNGSITFSANTTFTSTVLTTPVDSPIGVQSGYALLDGSITYRPEDKKYSIAIIGQNLTNKYYKQYGEQINGLVAYDVVGRPLFYGVRVTASF